MLDPIDLLKGSVSIASVSGNERQVAEYLVARMRTFAEEAFVDAAGNAVARLGRGARQVMVLGHIDTVPGEVPVRIVDNVLFGRGAVDAKGALCAAIAAAAQLSPEVLDGLTLTIIGAVEEEAPSSKGARYAVTAYPQPDLVIIGEPSGWEAVTIGYKGRLVVRLSCEWANFHSARNETTAAELLVEAWFSLKGWADGVNEGIAGLFDRVQLSLQGISSDSNGLTQRSDAVMGLRLPPWLSPHAAEEAARDCLAPYPGLSLSFTGHEAAYRSPKDTPLTRAFRVAIRAAGGKPRLMVKTGTSDMNVVAPHWDVPMLAYGPGNADFDHRPDEQLPLEEYRRAIDVLRAALMRLAIDRTGGASQD
jgi:LysW-gamma-L-lysine carboxypeptidase